MTKRQQTLQRKYFIECTLKRSGLIRINKESEISVLIVWGVIISYISSTKLNSIVFALKASKQTEYW